MTPIKESLYDREANRLRRQGGVSSPSTTTNTNKAGVAPTANPLVMDGFLFPDQKSLNAYKAKKAQG